MIMRKQAIIVALSLALGTSAAPLIAEEAKRNVGFKVGVLRCKSDPSTQKNLVVHSSVQVACEFEYNDGQVDHYTGESGIGVGVDLNWQRESELVYTVLAASQDATPGSGDLAGRFAGSKANVSLGVGGGARVLVGGSENRITLQPLALTTSEGLSIAGGVGFLTLKHAPSD
jgi:hypothetical protein